MIHKQPYLFCVELPGSVLCTLLPCNVIVQKHEPDSLEVAAVDPQASTQGVSNAEIETIAGEVKKRLQKVSDRLTTDK